MCVFVARPIHRKTAATYLAQPTISKTTQKRAKQSIAKDQIALCNCRDGACCGLTAWIALSSLNQNHILYVVSHFMLCPGNCFECRRTRRATANICILLYLHIWTRIWTADCSGRSTIYADLIVHCMTDQSGIGVLLQRYST